MPVPTHNKFMVGLNGDEVYVMKTAAHVTKADALNLAAWLVALADDNDEFPALLEKIRNT